MGYNVIYENGFPLTQKVTKKFADIILNFSRTRHYRRNITSYGLEGEMFLDPTDKMFPALIRGNINLSNEDYNKILFEKYHIIDYNKPPLTQPGLWCKWVISKNRKEIVWNQSEKFYNGPEWLQYLIDNFLSLYNYEIIDGASTRFFDESQDHQDDWYKDKDPKWTINTTKFWNGIVTVNNNIVNVEYRT